MKRQWSIAWVLGALFAAGGSACTNFEDPTIVIDLRMLGAIAEPPELLVALDSEPEDLANLPPIEVCALVADPGESRELSFSMVACAHNERRAAC
jgi:hypothetical protein